MYQGWRQLYKHCWVIQLHLPNSLFLEWNWMWRFVFFTSILLYGNVISWSFIDKIFKPIRNSHLSGCLSGCMSLHFFVFSCVHMFVILHFFWNVGIGLFRDLGLQWSGAEITAWERAKSEVALISIQNKEPCWWAKISRNSVLESEKLFVREKHLV